MTFTDSYSADPDLSDKVDVGIWSALSPSIYCYYFSETYLPILIQVSRELFFIGFMVKLTPMQSLSDVITNQQFIMHRYADTHGIYLVNPHTVEDYVPSNLLPLHYRIR